VVVQECRRLKNPSPLLPRHNNNILIRIALFSSAGAVTTPVPMMMMGLMLAMLDGIHEMAIEIHHAVDHHHIIVVVVVVMAVMLVDVAVVVVVIFLLALMVADQAGEEMRAVGVGEGGGGGGAGGVVVRWRRRGGGRDEQRGTRGPGGVLAGEHQWAVGIVFGGRADGRHHGGLAGELGKGLVHGLFGVGKGLGEHFWATALFGEVC